MGEGEWGGSFLTRASLCLCPQPPVHQGETGDAVPGPGGGPSHLQTHAADLEVLLQPHQPQVGTAAPRPLPTQAALLLVPIAVIVNGVSGVEGVEGPALVKCSVSASVCFSVPLSHEGISRGFQHPHLCLSRNRTNRNSARLYRKWWTCIKSGCVLESSSLPPLLAFHKFNIGYDIITSIICN